MNSRNDVHKSVEMAKRAAFSAGLAVSYCPSTESHCDHFPQADFSLTIIQAAGTNSVFWSAGRGCGDFHGTPIQLSDVEN
jgi:hypothetical protein